MPLLFSPPDHVRETDSGQVARQRTSVLWEADKIGDSHCQRQSLTFPHAKRHSPPGTDAYTHMHAHATPPQQHTHRQGSARREN